MIKRTPQEIADFFGCYVARDADRRWHIFKEKPELNLGYHRKENTLIKNGIYLNPELINTDNVYKLAVLYEPQKTISPESTVINKESDENCQKSGLCPHSDEVYTHREYVVAEGKRVRDLTNKVNILLAHGWKPQGGIFVEYLPESDGYAESTEFYYQAMVRGV